MVRWVLVRGDEVRGYLLHPPASTETDEDLLTDAKRRLVFGADDDSEALMEPEGEWLIAPPDAGCVGDGWRYVDGVFLPRKMS